MLSTIGYKVGAPTVLEYIDRCAEELADILPKSDKFHKICLYLAKMACHSYDLQQISPSLLAASIYVVALRVMQKTDTDVDVEKIM